MVARARNATLTVTRHHSGQVLAVACHNWLIVGVTFAVGEMERGEWCKLLLCCAPHRRQPRIIPIVIRTAGRITQRTVPDAQHAVTVLRLLQQRIGRFVDGAETRRQIELQHRQPDFEATGRIGAGVGPTRHLQLIDGPVRGIGALRGESIMIIGRVRRQKHSIEVQIGFVILYYSCRGLINLLKQTDIRAFIHYLISGLVDFERFI